jgi:hypothetical protein
MAIMHLHDFQLLGARSAFADSCARFEALGRRVRLDTCVTRLKRKGVLSFPVTKIAYVSGRPNPLNALINERNELL